MVDRRHMRMRQRDLLQKTKRCRKDPIRCLITILLGFYNVRSFYGATFLLYLAIYETWPVVWLNHWSPILGCQNHLRQIISIGARSDHSLEGWRVRGGRVRGSHKMKVRIRKESPGQPCMFIWVWLKIVYTVVYGPHGNLIGKMMIHQWNLRYPVLRQTHIQPMEQVWWMVSRESCWNIPWSTFRKAFLHFGRHCQPTA